MNLSWYFTYILFYLKHTDQTASFHMLGHQLIFHSHFSPANTQIRLCGCTCLDTSLYFTYIDAQNRQQGFTCLNQIRSDCVAVHAWTPAHISLTFYSTANTQIRLQIFTYLDASSYFAYILFYCKQLDQTERIHML